MDLATSPEPASLRLLFPRPILPCYNYVVMLVSSASTLWDHYMLLEKQRASVHEKPVACTQSMKGFRHSVQDCNTLSGVQTLNTEFADLQMQSCLARSAICSAVFSLMYSCCWHISTTRP